MASCVHRKADGCLKKRKPREDRAAGRLPAREGPSQEEGVDSFSAMPEGRGGNGWMLTEGDPNSKSG